MQYGLPKTFGRHVCHATSYRRLSVAWRHASPRRGACLGPRVPRCNQSTKSATREEPVTSDDHHGLSTTMQRHSRLSLEEASTGVNAQRLWLDLVKEKDAAKLTGLLQEAGDSPIDVPMRVLRKIVQRPYISPATLYQVMNYLRLRHASEKVPMDELLGWYRELLHHARAVSPESMDTATSLFLHWAPPSSVASDVSERTAIKAIQQRTALLNSAMEELGGAPKIRPYVSSIMQEGLQFRLLQYMAEHDPPLHVSRKSYRAVVRVQLRLPKTENEQHWASLKALSWPPWKQDRNAMDSELGPEYGRSNARTTLMKQASSGYPEDAWDRAASVYAGQEVDGTPTIQTRRDMMGYLVGKLAASSLWVARIAATRTMQEAWMVWLEYREAVGHEQQNDVTLAILMRLHQEETGLRRHSGLPGDGTEIDKPPASIHLHTYTRSAPPTTHQFFETIFSEREAAGLKMGTTLAAYFVANASSFQQAHEYLDRLGKWYKISSRLLLSGDSMIWTQKGWAKIEKMPARLRVAAIVALCRFVGVPNVDSQDIDSGLYSPWQHAVDDHSETANTPTRSEITRNHNLARAVWLAQKLPPERQSVPWRAILRVLNDSPNNIRMQYLTKMVADATSERSNRFPQLTAEERIRLRYDMLTIQSYQLTLQVAALINKSIPLDVDMLYEVTKMTAHCAWSCWTTLSKSVDTERGEVLSEVFQSSQLTPLIQTIIASHPERTLMQTFEKAAGSATASNSTRESNAADELILDEDSGWSHHNPSTSFSTLNFEEERATSTLSTPSNLSISTAHLHQWVRALGLLGKHEDLLDLLQRVHDNTIGVFHDTSPRAIRMLRSAVVAVQVSLERPYLDEGLIKRLQGPDLHESMVAKLYLRLCERAAPEVVEKAKLLLHTRFGESLGSWPSAKESAEYCTQGHLGTMRKPRVV